MLQSRFSRVVAVVLAFALLVATPVPVGAQRVHVGVGVGWGYPGWGYPGWGWGPGWGYGPYWGWGPYWGGPWGWGGWGWPGPYYDYPSYAEARILIVPKEAEVFVDGYRAGIVDDFDGFLQRLNVWPGDHEITLFLEGYKTEHHKLYFNDGTTASIKGTMEKLAAGEKSEPPPVPAPREERRGRGGRGGRGSGSGDANASMQTQTQSQSTRPRVEPRETTVTVQQEPVRYGGVSIKVQPADAVVQIDEQTWTIPADPSSPGSEARLNVQLAVGRHEVAIRKEGFATYTETVLIRAGATLTLNVSLTKK
jgi:hypothetical protein